MADPLITPKLIAIIGSLVILLLFILKAITHRADITNADSFMFASSELGKEGIANNLSATATSLATALLFIILQSPDYGFIIFVVVFLFWTGHKLFLKLVKDIKPSPESTGSIFRFLLIRTSSKRISILVNIIVLINYLILLLIELVLGATIFNFFLPKLEYSSLYLIVGISLFAFSYVLIGGFKTVAYSDGWQFRLLYWSVIITFVLMISSYLLSGRPAFELIKIIRTPEGSFVSWFVFILNAIFVNVSLPTCQISSWQRFSSSKSKKDFINGYNDSLSLKSKHSFVWVWIIFVFVSFMMYQVGGKMNSLSDVFNFISEQGIFGSALVFSAIIHRIIGCTIKHCRQFADIFITCY